MDYSKFKVQKDYNAKLKAHAEKRKASIRKMFKTSKLSRKEFAARLGMSRQNLERLLK